MPIYEYRCQSCRRKVTLFVRGFDTPSATCTFCGGSDLVRLISTFAVVKSEESRLAELGDPDNLGDLDESDPRSMARWARKMSQEMGEDMGPEFDEMVERMEAGEIPDELAGETGGMDELSGLGEGVD